jgi:molybdate transport system substrate-binding protein
MSQPMAFSADSGRERRIQRGEARRHHGPVVGVLCWFAAVVLLPSGLSAQPGDALRVFSSNGVRAALEEIQPQIEKAVGADIEFEFSTARTLVARLADGEAFDVALLTPELIDQLAVAGRVAAETRIDVAQVGIGVGVRPDWPAADVATPEALRSVLLEANSVAYGANGQSRQTNEAAFARLGIADELRGKTRLTGPGEAPLLVASGDVDVVLTLISELLREPGLRFLGPLPDPLQGYIRFTAAESAAPAHPAAAAALMRFLIDPELAVALRRHGLEPVGND